MIEPLEREVEDLVAKIIERQQALILNPLQVPAQQVNVQVDADV
jgi:hypothetical protein